MDTNDSFTVSNEDALRFFFERLKDISAREHVGPTELLYNASVLAHFASTSTVSTGKFPACPADLATVFDVFVLDRSAHSDPEVMEAAGSECLVLTGFFADQLRDR